MYKLKKLLINLLKKNFGEYAISQISKKFSELSKVQGDAKSCFNKIKLSLKTIKNIFKFNIVRDRSRNSFQNYCNITAKYFVGSDRGINNFSFFKFPKIVIKEISLDYMPLPALIHVEKIVPKWGHPFYVKNIKMGDA